ncbi:hypothetical protein [Proteiniphilum sp. UBA1028]|jgi:hypothetical protein|uniref:hypothetical protein n=1 Tax=Proteiniphilum sp. UBA1028 TaxID=1947251 RepID=UPI0025CF0143|nr:hypothetical protein [Proteiniphilum sp. UBA1028]
MKNLKNIFAILLLFLIFSNCEHKEIIEVPVEEGCAILNFEIFYKPENHNEYLPDTGTKVYIFYNISLTEVTLYRFFGGRLVHGYGTDIIYPDKIDQIEDNGAYKITPPTSLSKILIYFVSNYYNEVGLKSTFSDDLLNYHQYEQDIKIFFDYSDLSGNVQVLKMTGRNNYDFSAPI